MTEMPFLLSLPWLRLRRPGFLLLLLLPLARGLGLIVEAGMLHVPRRRGNMKGSAVGGREGGKGRERQEIRI